MRDSITLRVSPKKADHLRLGLCDLLCWCRGFMAAQNDEFNMYGPLGMEEAKELNCLVRDALAELKDEGQ